MMRPTFAQGYGGQVASYAIISLNALGGRIHQCDFDFWGGMWHYRGGI